MTRPSPLISAEELRDLLAAGTPLVIIDARPNRAAYESGHLPGALHARLDSDLSDASARDFDPAHGGRHPLPAVGRWSATLGGWGIGPETPVIVHDDQDASNAAARAWWMLRSVGHQDVRVLDGGFRAAVEAGLPVETAAVAPVAADAYPAERWSWPVKELREVDALRLADEWRVLDVRSGPRYRGETEPIDPVAGHIPGAVNLFFELNMNRGRFKSPAELREQYETLLDGRSPERLVVHCGSGVTACHTLLALDAAGLKGASLYVGSWSEWCRNDLPRA